MKVMICKPYIQTEDGKTRLTADIKAGDDTFSLWYEVEEQYAKYLVTEHSDSFVVVLLPWAMMKAKKLQESVTLTCENPLSARLYHQLINYYIPVLSDSISYYAPIKLETETDAQTLPCVGAVGTGVSGGVDSSYTITKYKDYQLQPYRLTHAVYYNVGIYGGFESCAEKGIQTKTRQIAHDTGLEYVQLTSNVCLTLYKAAHAPIVPAVFFSAALSLQKLFGVYYYSSAFIAKDFKMSEEDAAYYDLLNVHSLSTENLTFYSSGIERSRLEKLVSIANAPIVQNNLLVCLNVKEQAINCNHCAKCTRTMAELEVLGKLDNFRNVFNVEEFRKNKGYHWGYILLKSKSDVFCEEIIDIYKSQKKHFSLNVHWSTFLKWVKRGFTSVNKARRRVEDEIR